jgi:thymidylate synthase (FAD)
MNHVKFISITPDAEKLIAYCARVSNPNNQDKKFHQVHEYTKENRYMPF